MTWAAPGYTELRELGAGASGRVVLARHDATGTLVAIKYLSEAFVGDAGFRARFGQEAELLGEIDSPHVARLYEYLEDDCGAAIVMQAVQGVTLRELIARGGPTGPEAALVVLKGSLLGLAAAHRLGVVHRDYKPANVLVGPEGTSTLVDFGIALRAGAAATASGTPQYMAPEQWEGRPATPQTDIYAATATVVECLTGAPPYRAADVRALALAHRNAPLDLEVVPGPVRGLVGSGMAKEPAGRPGTAEAFVAELDKAAHAAYGPGWEAEGRLHLAARVAALASLLPYDGTDASATTTGTAIGKVAMARPLDAGARRARRGQLALTGALVAVLAAAGALLVTTGDADPTNTVTLASTTGGDLSGEAPRDPVDPGTVVPGPTGPDPDPELDIDIAGVTVEPARFRGDCPGGVTTIGFRAALSGPPGSGVDYRWLRSDGQVEPVQTVRLSSSGSAEVSSAWKRGPGSGWRALEVISPDAERSAPAVFSVACTTAESVDPSGAEAPPEVTAVEFAELTGDGGNMTGTVRVLTSGPGPVQVGFGYTDGGGSAQSLSGSTTYDVPFMHTFAAGSEVCQVTVTTTPPAPGGDLVGDRPCAPAAEPATVKFLGFAAVHHEEDGSVEGTLRVKTDGTGPVDVELRYGTEGDDSVRLSGRTSYEHSFRHPPLPCGQDFGFSARTPDGLNVIDGGIPPRSCESGKGPAAGKKEDPGPPGQEPGADAGSGDGSDPAPDEGDSAGEPDGEPAPGGTGETAAGEPG